MSTLPIAVPAEFIAEFCGRSHIRRLSFFGSVLTPRFRSESDIDVRSKVPPAHTTRMRLRWANAMTTGIEVVTTVIAISGRARAIANAVELPSIAMISPA